MSATLQRTGREIPTLHSGDQMTQPEFHRAYLRMSKSTKAELIEGVVYVASPVGIEHADMHFLFATMLGMYVLATPGVRGADNATTILGEEDEPQPDLSLRILPDFGGQSRTEDNHIVGAPELIAEIAHSSRALDLHTKRSAYRQNGVLEYLVADIEDERLHWFDLRADQELTPDSDGVFRVRTFPGLWIDGAALFAYDLSRLTAALNAGLASPQHVEFVAALATRRTGS